MGVGGGAWGGIFQHKDGMHFEKEKTPTELFTAAIRRIIHGGLRDGIGPRSMHRIFVRVLKESSKEFTVEKIMED
jgi:hypothetical protein